MHERDTLVVSGPHFINRRGIRFVKHDEEQMNFRRAVFTRKSWIMLLGYPLDLKGCDSQTGLWTVCTNLPLKLH
jgi:hypothetical protein